MMESLSLGSQSCGPVHQQSDGLQRRLTLARDVRCLDFDLDGAQTYGALRTALEERGTPLGPYDMMIAAHALSMGLIVVTDNEREFRRVKSLRIENWRVRRD